MVASAIVSTAVIEQAGWRDLIPLRQLEQVCFPEDAWPIFDLIGVLTFPNVVRLKATHQGQMVGFIAGDVRGTERIAWIATIGVLPDYRGRGIGSKLLMACEQRLPVATIRLCVRLTNAPAIHMYQQHGYMKLDEWPRYYHDGESALVMEKKPHPDKVGYN